MRIFAADHEFPYSWNEVSAANWRKYSPWNKESDHVIAVDTLSRQLDPKTGVLRTERLITCKQNAPKWLTSFLGGADVSHVYEVSYVTPPSAPVMREHDEQVGKLQGREQTASVAPAAVEKVEQKQPTTDTRPQAQRSSSSIWKRAIWSRSPSPAPSTTSTPRPSSESQTSQQPQPQPQSTISQTEKQQQQQQQQQPLAHTTHIPSTPPSPSRPSASAPPPTQPQTDHLPSPPSHPGPRAPSITMLSTNLTFSDLLSVRETVTYTPSPSSPDIHTGKTRFEQNARITAMCGGWAKVREKIEGFTVERFGQNAERGRKGFEGVLAEWRRVFGEEQARERGGAVQS